MEILSDILTSLRVDGSVYFCSQVEAPWSKTFEGRETASFHMLRKGACWLVMGDSVEQLGPGDLVFLGSGVDHVLTSEPPNGETAPFTENTLLLCGYCRFDHDVLTPFKALFPQVSIVRVQELLQHPWLKSTFDQLSAEYMAQNLGTEIIVNKLTEVVLVELIRINFGRQQHHSFLNALQDKRISKALQHIHDAPGEPWTLERLANEVGMSRAAFAKHFRELVGETMFTYLSQLRVQRAKDMLKTSKITVDDIAVQVGYESERAFNKTFAKYLGMTPKQYRKYNE